MIEYYPYAMANEKYARLAPPKTFNDAFARPAEASQTMWNAVVKKKGHDPQLANLEDNLKRGGSLLIATMATLGLSNKILGIGEFLGFLSWYGAMAITPKVINAMVWLKTGVNLGEEYINTQGYREQLFKDRKYLPLHLIPDERIEFIADRLGIPEGIPDRRRLTEEKIAQVSVQGRTWWMLAAAPATVAISGFICNLLEDKFAGLVNQIKRYYRLNHGLMPLLQKEGKLKPEEVIPQMDLYLEQKIGKISNSELSRWWRHLGKTLPKRLGLDRELSLRDMLDTVSKDTLTDKLASTLAKIGETPDKTHLISATQEFLKESRAYLGSFETELVADLEKFRETLGPAYMDEYRLQIRDRVMNATTTLLHYENLLKEVKHKAKPEILKELLEKPVLPEILKMMDEGKLAAAKKFIGSESMYQEIRSLTGQGAFQVAFEKLGAAPGNHLINSLKTIGLERLWKRRIVWGLGGGLLIASALFCKFFLGRNFGKTAEGLPENFKRNWDKQEGFKWS